MHTPHLDKPQSEAEAHYRCMASVQAIQRMLCEYERAVTAYRQQPLMLADHGRTPTQRIEDAATLLVAMTKTLKTCSTDFVTY